MKNFISQITSVQNVMERVIRDFHHLIKDMANGIITFILNTNAKNVMVQINIQVENYK